MGYINKEDTIKELQFYLFDSEEESCIYNKEEMKLINTGMKFAIKIVKQMLESKEIISVRCKDCKYYDTEFTNFAGKHRCNYFLLGINDDNFYCGQGEIK